MRMHTYSTVGMIKQPLLKKLPITRSCQLHANFYANFTWKKMLHTEFLSVYKLCTQPSKHIQNLQRLSLDLLNAWFLEFAGQDWKREREEAELQDYISFAAEEHKNKNFALSQNTELQQQPCMPVSQHKGCSSVSHYDGSCTREPEVTCVFLILKQSHTRWPLNKAFRGIQTVHEHPLVGVQRSLL